jgi:hypothetical protein
MAECVGLLSYCTSSGCGTRSCFQVWSTTQQGIGARSQAMHGLYPIAGGRVLWWFAMPWLVWPVAGVSRNGTASSASHRAVAIPSP